jgi:hypothetical protein
MTFTTHVTLLLAGTHVAGAIMRYMSLQRRRYDCLSQTLSTAQALSYVSCSTANEVYCFSTREARVLQLSATKAVHLSILLYYIIRTMSSVCVYVSTARA